jgi:hypothetical protein
MSAVRAATNRWVPVAVVAGVLVGLNLLARLVARFALPEGQEDEQFVVGLISLAGMVLTMGYAGFWWARRHGAVRILEDLTIAGFAGALLAVLIGPFVSGDTPFGNGAGFWFAQLGLCAAVLIVGAFGGVWLAIMLGLDPRSRSWHHQSEDAARRAQQVRRTT